MSAAGRRSDLAFPAVADRVDGAVLALLFQLEQTEWWPERRLRDAQLRQLHSLLRHAHSHVPWYRERMDACGFDAFADFGWEEFTRLPVLTRAELQQHRDALMSRRPIPAHGAVTSATSSGSTGMPVRFSSTGWCATMWNAMTLRDHRWHRRDLAAKLAVIRVEEFEGVLKNWGRATAAVTDTGPAVLLSISRPVERQVAWLVEQDPAYLLTYPTNLEAILRHCAKRGLRLPHLREARTLSEAMSPHLRGLCGEVWGVPLTDLYSVREAGYVALQCPEAAHYHVQSENVVVEIVDGAGRACPPGQEGRVLLTVLHNFAMPLIRYDVGDIAVPGGPCGCGRGLPVIERVAGRVRNMMTRPDGSLCWPYLGPDFYGDLEPVTQFQLVQVSRTKLELHVVARRGLDAGEEEAMKRKLNASLEADFAIDVVRRDAIARGAGGKYEEFVSRIAPGAA